MWDFIVFKDGQLGTGKTQEEAERDLLVNIARNSSLGNWDTSFIRRRNEICPWLPAKNMLHLSGIGCIEHEGGMLVNHKTGKSVLMTEANIYSIYTYLALLCGSELSYEDIAVCAAPEIDELFQGISPKFKKLREYPYIHVANVMQSTDIETAYILKGGLSVCTTGRIVGLAEYGDTLYYTVDMESKDDILDMLSYIGYRTGIVYARGMVRENGKENNVTG